MKKTMKTNVIDCNSHISLTNEGRKDVFANETEINPQGKVDKANLSPKS